MSIPAAPLAQEIPENFPKFASARVDANVKLAGHMSLLSKAEASQRIRHAFGQCGRAVFECWKDAGLREECPDY